MKDRRLSALTANNYESDTQQETTHPTESELKRIGEITEELARLQEQQTRLIEELRDLTTGKDPPGVDWIYPDPHGKAGKNTQNQRKT